jgi:hypothetical protein
LCQTRKTPTLINFTLLHKIWLKLAKMDQKWNFEIFHLLNVIVLKLF